MTPEIHKEYEHLKLFTDSLSGLLYCLDENRLEKFEDLARPFANGTMGIIALQSMGIQDLKRSEENLTHAIRVSRKLRELKTLLVRLDEKEAA